MSTSRISYSSGCTSIRGRGFTSRPAGRGVAIVLAVVLVAHALAALGPATADHVPVGSPPEPTAVLMADDLEDALVQPHEREITALAVSIRDAASGSHDSTWTRLVLAFFVDGEEAPAPFLDSIRVSLAMPGAEMAGIFLSFDRVDGPWHAEPADDGVTVACEPSCAADAATRFVVEDFAHPVAAEGGDFVLRAYVDFGESEAQPRAFSLAIPTDSLGFEGTLVGLDAQTRTRVEAEGPEEDVVGALLTLVGLPTRVAWHEMPPADAVAGDTWPVFTARVEDAQGNAVHTPVEVGLERVDGDGILLGGLTGITLRGLVDFDSVRYERAESAGIVATAAGLASSPVATVDVASADLESLVVSGPENVVAATSVSFAAAGFDGFGNLVTLDALTWTSTCGAIDEEGGFTAPAQVPEDGAPPCAVSAEGEAASLFAADEAIVEILPDVVASVGLECEPAVVGKAFACEATPYDVHGNVADAAVIFEALDADGTALAASGDGGFVAPTSIALGPLLVTATSDGVASDGVLVPLHAGPPAEVLVVSAPAEPVVAGSTWPALVLQIKDEHGNDVEGVHVVTLVAPEASAPPEGMLQVDAVDGIAVFDAVFHTVAESLVVEAHVQDLVAVAAIDVVPAPAAHVVITLPSEVDALDLTADDDCITFAAQGFDAYGNAVADGVIEWHLEPADLGVACGSGGSLAFEPRLAGEGRLVVVAHDVEASIPVKVSTGSPFEAAFVDLPAATDADTAVVLEAVLLDRHRNVIPAQFDYRVVSGEGVVASDGTFTPSRVGAVEVLVEAREVTQDGPGGPVVSALTTLQVVAGRPVAIGIAPLDVERAFADRHPIIYEAVVVDAHGNVVTDEEVVWSVTDRRAGFFDGAVLHPTWGAGGVFEIRAGLVGDAQVSAATTLTVTGGPDVESPPPQTGGPPPQNTGDTGSGNSDDSDDSEESEESEDFHGSDDQADSGADHSDDPDDSDAEDSDAPEDTPTDASPTQAFSLTVNGRVVGLLLLKDPEATGTLTVSHSAGDRPSAPQTMANAFFADVAVSGAGATLLVDASEGEPDSWRVFVLRNGEWRSYPTQLVENDDGVFLEAQLAHGDTFLVGQILPDPAPPQAPPAEEPEENEEKPGDEEPEGSDEETLGDDDVDPGESPSPTGDDDSGGAEVRANDGGGRAAAIDEVPGPNLLLVLAALAAAGYAARRRRA